MTRRQGRRADARLSVAIAVALVLGGLRVDAAHGVPRRQPEPTARRQDRRLPNVVLILADDLGYGEVGVYGQTKIATPSIDRLAADGIRFTDFYAGDTVCAPSRAVLMTGQHTGHVSVRGNAAGGDLTIQTLRENDYTIAQLFKDAGFATALFGKWGLGEVGSTGHPNRKGFDEMFGYLNQTHAHNYFPSFLVHGSERVPLRNVAARETPERGDGYAKERIDYAPDLILERALRWIDENKDRPFFLFFATTLPHANNERTRATGDGMEIPEYGAYANRPWPNPDKGLAAMISRLDTDVGRITGRIASLGLANDTLVVFTSDNGPHREGGNTPGFFGSSGPFRGFKRDLYEGGIRVPLIVRWPGRVLPARVSAHVGYLGDFFATFASIVGRPLPRGLDSVSFTPTLLGDTGSQQTHDCLYWEFYENGGAQAVRFGSWKAVRKAMGTGPVELYDLASDPGERHDVAASNPATVERAKGFMDRAHTSDPRWVVR
jgi:arylsulfatase A-like enzyme